MLHIQKTINSTLDSYAPQDIFIAFDVDFTLTVPSEKAAQMPNIIEHKEIYQKIMRSLTPSQQYVILNLLAEASSHHLIEEDSLLILQSLQKKGLRPVAFSACLTGSLINIPKLEVWRYETLKKLGIDFSNSIPHVTKLVLTQTSPFLNRYPIFYKGALCASTPLGKNTKGPVLTTFFKELSLHPKVVIMVDDTKEHLEDIEDSLKNHDPSIIFVGVEYTKGREFSSGPLSQQEFLSFWEKLANQACQITC